MYVTLRESVDQAEWDMRLQHAGAEAGLCQSVFWARVSQQADAARPLFLEVRVQPEGAPLLTLLALHRRPWNRLENRPPGTSWRNRWCRGWVEWADGPVFLVQESDVRKCALATVLAWLRKYAVQHRLSRIGSLAPARTSIRAGDPEVRTVMREHRFNVFPWATLLVDLTCPDDELLRAADRSVRKNLKNALAAGCKVSILQEPDQVKARYLPACSAIEAALGKPAPCVRVADIVLAEDKARWYRHAVAESAAGEPLATLGMYCFNGVATEIASVLSPLALERKIPAQDLLHWEMLLAAKRAGCHTFDLAGVNPDPQTPKEAGIRRFKEKWGGKYREYDTFSRELGWRELVGRFRQRVQAMRDLMRPKRPHA